MPITHDGERTIDGVRVGVARLCPLCDDVEELRSRDREMIIWEGEPRWAHPGCVKGYRVLFDEKLETA